MPSSAPSVPLPVPLAGVRPDLDARDVPAQALIAAENWVVRNGLLQTRPGLVKLAATVGQRPMGMISYDHESENDRIVMGTTLGWWRYNPGSGAWVDITEVGNLLSGSQTSHVIFRTFKKGSATWLIGVNGSNVPKAWDGTAGAYRDVAGLPPLATCAAVANNRLLLAIDDQVWVSADLDFDTGWGTELVAALGETPGKIRGMLESGNTQLYVYKDSAVYVGFAQADAVHPFRFQVARVGVPGPVSPAALFALSDGRHCYLAPTGEVMVWDGVSATSLGPHVQAYITVAADWDKIERAWGFYDATHREIYMFFPSSGSADITSGVMITYPDARMWPIRLGAPASSGIHAILPTATMVGDLTMPIGSIDITIGEMAQGRMNTILAGVSGQAYTLGGADDDGTPISAWFTTGLWGGGLRRWMQLHEIELAIGAVSPDQTMFLELLVSNYGEDPTVAESRSLTVGAASTHRALFRRTARRFAMTVRGDFDAKVEWHGAEAAASGRGLR